MPTIIVYFVHNILYTGAQRCSTSKNFTYCRQINLWPRSLKLLIQLPFYQGIIFVYFLFSRLTSIICVSHTSPFIFYAIQLLWTTCIVMWSFLMLLYLEIAEIEFRWFAKDLESTWVDTSKKQKKRERRSKFLYRSRNLNKWKCFAFSLDILSNISICVCSELLLNILLKRFSAIWIRTYLVFHIVKNVYVLT